MPDDANGAPGTPAPISLKITNKAAPVRTPAASTTPAPAEAEGAEEDEDVDADGEIDETTEGLGDYKGKSFQKAQEQLIDELIEYVEPDSELQIFTPFHFLPPRTLTDYYDTIKKPVSLKAIQKQVAGKVGRMPPTGTSIFGTWDLLENELSFIWKNCREYNEDGSEMYNLAGEFEEVCKARLALARSQVPGPAGTKIKLNMSATPASAVNPTIKLKFGGSKASPSPAPEKTPGTDRATPSADGDAAQLQQTTTNGRPVSAAGRHPISRSASAAAQGLTRGASAASPPVQTNGVKAEGQSPALSAVRPTSAAPATNGILAMPPPAGVNSRPVSGSPHPQMQPGLFNAVQASTPYQPPPAANNFMPSKLRPNGQSK